MSAEHTGTEVFEDVDPDPDAVLAEFGVESPDELAIADAGGAHDPISDERVDADDTTAAELFADLEAVADGDSRERGSDEAAESRPTSDDGTIAEPTAASVPEFEEFEAAFVGEPDVIGREDEGLVEATAVELNAVAARTFDAGETTDEVPTDESGAESPEERDAAETDARAVDRSDGSGSPSTATSSERTLTVSAGTSDDLELVGPGPTATRVSNDAFGRAGAGGS